MLGYPGIFRGALLSGAREINVEMKLAAAHVIADLTEASTSLVPDVLDPNVHERVAEAVRDAAIESAGWRGWSACRRRGWQAGAWTRPPSTAQRFEEAMLFKAFANVDAFPICLDLKDPDEILAAVKAIAPSFGGINREDISAPRSLEIQDRRERQMPSRVFRAERRGTGGA